MTVETDRVARQMLAIYDNEARWCRVKPQRGPPIGIGERSRPLDLRSCTIVAARDIGLSCKDAADTYALLVKACSDMALGRNPYEFNYNPATTITQIRHVITAIISEATHADEEFAANLFPATPEIPLPRPRFAD